MDSKITLSFNQTVIEQAKQYAEANNISLSRLIEFLLKKVTSGGYNSLEEFPISDWVNQLAEGQAEYKTANRSRKGTKSEYFSAKRR